MGSSTNVSPTAQRTIIPYVGTVARRFAPRCGACARRGGGMGRGLFHLYD